MEQTAASTVSPQQPAGYKRRRYLIHRGLQLRYSIMFVVIGLIGSAASVIAFNFFGTRKLEDIMWSTHFHVSSTGEILKSVSLLVYAADLLFISLLLVLMGMWMMKKTAGPIYRMTNDVEKIASGDLTASIHLRQKDAFGDVADELNGMAESLRTRFVRLEETYNELSSELRRNMKKGGEDYSGLRDRLRSVEQILEEFTDYPES